MQRIISATPLPGHRLRLRFEDGVEGTVDLSDLVGKGVFAPWTNEKAFAAVAIDRATGTVTWPGGIDLCPDTLHEEITGGSVFDSEAKDRAG
jgi:hypothetical protein